MGGRRGPVTVTTWEGSIGRHGGPVNVTTWEGSMGRRRGLVTVTTREGSTLGCKVQLAVQPLPSLSISDMSVSSDTDMPTEHCHANYWIADCKRHVQSYA